MTSFSHYDNSPIPIGIINGRVNALNKDNNLNFLNTNIYDLDKIDDSFKSDALSRNKENTPLSDLFFSAMNIEALHEGLRIMVLEASDGKYNINKQSNTEMKLIMRAIFIEYAMNYIDISVVEQVKQLNKIILDWCVPRVISNIKQKEKYIEDISMLPRPIDRPEMWSMKGTKQLELKSFFGE